MRHAKETEREMKQRLQLQKREHEGAMTRHLSFIDQVRASSLRCIAEYMLNWKHVLADLG